MEDLLQYFKMNRKKLIRIIDLREVNETCVIDLKFPSGFTTSIMLPFEDSEFLKEKFEQDEKDAEDSEEEEAKKAVTDHVEAEGDMVIEESREFSKGYQRGYQEGWDKGYGDAHDEVESREVSE